jgi:hypothetical protein
LLPSQSLPDSLDKQGTIQGLKNQRSAATTGYQMQHAQDSMNVADQQFGPAMQKTLGTIADQWSNMTGDIIKVITRTMDGLNNNPVTLATGQYKKGDVGRTLLGAGQSMLRRSLQAAEGAGLKALGSGKADGSKQNPWYVIDATAAGAPSSIGLSSPARVAQIGLQDLVPGTSFIRPFIDALPHFAGGGDILAGHPSIVGEMGPELFTPRSAGRITPNHEFGGGNTYHSYQIDARRATDPAAVHAAVARALPHAVAASVQPVHAREKRSPQGR